MKTLIITLIILLSAGFENVYSNTTSDTTKNDGQFIDKNNNGTDDSQETGKCYRGKRNDKFIDKDGDGICDERDGKIRKGKKHQRGKNK